MICHIVGAGEPKNLPEVQAGDFLIAADGGLAVLEKEGIRPDLVIGDFDSLSYSVPSGVETVRLPVEKDDTDMLAAVRLGLARGYRQFYLYGGTGGRPDHTYANYQLLASLARQGLEAILFDGDYRMSAVSNGTFLLPETANRTVSVFALTDRAEGVTLSGLYYRLEDAVLTADMPLGVSNRIFSHPASVCVREGVLLVMWEE